MQASLSPLELLPPRSIGMRVPAVHVIEIALQPVTGGAGKGSHKAPTANGPRAATPIFEKKPPTPGTNRGVARFRIA
jgi:hypothetical protein